MARGVTTAPDLPYTQAQLPGKGDSKPGGKLNAKDPRSAEAALNYARKLRALGDKQ
jgi:hypothetical protein